jgi:uncharacterized protein (DUF983 family)
LHLRCPRCHEGKLFLNPNPYNLRDITMMYDTCPVCGQDYVIEPGFYFGAAYISYAINMALLISAFVVMFFMLHLDGPYLYFGLAGVVMALSPVIFRFSRSAWINIFVSYQAEGERSKGTEDRSQR